MLAVISIEIMSKTYKIVVMGGDYCGPEVYFVLQSPATLLIYSINDRLWLKLSRFDRPSWSMVIAELIYEA